MIKIIDSITSVKITNGSRVECFEKGELTASTSAKPGYVNIKNNRKTQGGDVFWEFFQHPLNRITDDNDTPFGLTDESAISALNSVFSITANLTRKQIITNINLTPTPTVITHNLHTSYFQVLCFNNSEPVDIITDEYTATTVKVSAIMNQTNTTIVLIG